VDRDGKGKAVPHQEPLPEAEAKGEAMIFVGIDPGKHGAIAWMDGERKTIEVHDCPLDGAEYDFQAMRDLLSGIISLHIQVTIEKVHSMPSDGKCSAFSFGVGYGAWLALVGGVLRVKPTLVDPRSWKRTMLAGIANDKAAEATALKQRFQGNPVCSQLHGPRGGLRDGRVDALILAEYGLLTWRLGNRAPCAHRPAADAAKP
jgi:hypothetical protein